MTDNILYLDEQGYPCDDYRDIHEAIEETTKILLSMTKEERIDWFRKSTRNALKKQAFRVFRKSRYPYPINFDMEIGNTVYSVSSHFNKAANESLQEKAQRIILKNL